MPLPSLHSCSKSRQIAALAIAALGALALVFANVVSAPAQDPQSELDAAQSELSEAEDQQGVLTTEIDHFTGKIDQLAGEVAVLRNREAMVEEQLRETQERLDQEHSALVALRGRLRRSLNVLSNRLVEIYKADTPDTLTVLLESEGFADLMERFEYLQRVEEQDSDIVDRVRTLRNETEDIVLRIRAARDEIAAKEAELERTRVALEEQEAELEAARAQRQSLLSNVENHIERLEGEIGDLEGQIQQQLSSSASPTLPAGPIQSGSGSMIWPVNGPVTSPFGWRWGRMHEGVDIAVPSGTPIRAAKAGVTAIAAPTGGYGNYTCVNHGGGLSTCYAHQSSYATSVGDSVGQGEVIGYVGCTGSCFGDHLHFEVRVNGSAVDPMGYL
jgi:murein DD-endopeptidase MepM/ murein hydrolase activator NlpD